ncbi:hypothetical protein HYPSUDRAFT_137760, partial [Hypholoma sublateritium FD-334 SS-4]
GRNIVLCVDGTSNQFGEKNTNVIELYNLILKKEEYRQRTWYNSGIGTYARPSWKSPKYYRQVIYHKVDLAIAWDFERTVLAAYRWLSDVYKTGDRIFLFGFSRGAFQVRVLSAMIDKVGLIYKGNELQIPFAYELYADPKSDDITATEVGSKGLGGSKDKTSSAERFKKAFSREEVKVHFVGAWDTVSSIGIARGTHMLPRTVDGMLHVCFFRHALALDERRVKFLPEYAYGGSTIPPAIPETKRSRTWKFWKPRPQLNAGAGEIKENPDSTTVPSQIPTENPGKKRPHTLEVWFAGTHSDIGGGNAENRGMDRSRPPLRWMALEAGAAGLRTAGFSRELSTEEQIEIKESLTRIWWILELLPLKRLTYTRRENGRPDTRKPHCGSPRKIHKGQKIHSSLLLAAKLIDGQAYNPKARPLEDNPDFWETSRNKGLGEWLEQDLYEIFTKLHWEVNQFISYILLGVAENISCLADGRKAVCEGLYKSVVKALEKPDPDYMIDKKWKLLKSTVDILSKSPDELKQAHSLKIRPLIRGLPTSTQHDRQIAEEFMAQCTTPYIALHGHEYSVRSVAFSPDGKHIVSGSLDKTIRIWDAETGKQIVQPLRGHTSTVISVAFSNDGKRIVSGSHDWTVCIWDVEAGKQVGPPFQRHTAPVLSVAFSLDDKHILSGSDDKTVRLWDLETGKEVRVFQCTDQVNSVAFSPDGKRIASGLYDRTILIWDAERGTQMGEPIRGHADRIKSIAFSPDGKHIVSGSDDNTVRIWDSETGRQVGEPLKGHTDSVLSVAFSPDGKRIVSGSFDGTVRMWNSETRQQIGEPYTGHTDWIWSVAFSPDGKYVVSGSEDKTVRIWDAET